MVSKARCRDVYVLRSFVFLSGFGSRKVDMSIMKKIGIMLIALAMIPVFSVSASAALISIGTATWDHENHYALIHDDAQHLIWLDYGHGADSWQNQVTWASGLGNTLWVTLDPLHVTDIDWGTRWRLPSLEDMASLVGNPERSSSLENLMDSTYWSGEEHNRTRAYFFDLADGAGAHAKKRDGYFGMAVRDGDVTATPVPVPATILLLASGLVGVGVGVLGRRIRQRTS